MGNNNFKVLKGKTIRDPIHGDIFFSEKFLGIIDTPEFQRLRRIHQLSVAYLVFPGAEHTRFSHSIGTYFIMQKIVEHFKPLMKNINLEMNDRDIDLVLSVALLHDIGHGPLSHAFESMVPNSKNHEDWSVEIITNKDSNINKVLKKNFDEDFPRELADLIGKEKSIKKSGFKYQEGEIDLFFILSSLISSQLDADRMDYLLRDSKYTGARFGDIDIERIISSMTLTVSGTDDNYYVCIINKFMADIEKYLLARYQMLKEIYLHPVKCEMENVIKKIFNRAFLTLKEDDGYIGSTLPGPLLELFRGNEITMEEYISLDDNILFSTISTWTKANDPILRKLCTCILNREKFTKIKILNDEENDLLDFKSALADILSRYGYEVENYDDEYFWIELKEKYNIYKEDKDNILIVKNDGTINDICKVSKIINEKLNGEKTMTFINFKIIKELIDDEDSEEAISDIKNLIKLYDNRNYIEIEKKYILKNFEVFKKVEEEIKDLGNYKVVSTEEPKIQADYYYDTFDKYLLNEDKTLRFRKVDDNLQLTIKTPTKAKELSKDKTNVQNERFEYEVSVSSVGKEINKDNIIKYLPEFEEAERWQSLEKSLIIINNRKKIKLINNDVVFEIVFDDVEYNNVNNGKKESEYQIEIELKSEYIHRINLKMFSDLLEERVPELIPMNESKYKRGTVLTQGK